MQIYTAAEKGLLEELEAVIDRRSADKRLSLVGVAGVTDGLAMKCQMVLEAAQSHQADQEISLGDDTDDDGDGWKDEREPAA